MMAKYKVRLARSASREIERLPKAMLKRVFHRLESLAEEPFPRGTRKIRGAKGLWRLRVGDYRIVYRVDEEAREVTVLVVRHRRDVYRL